MASEDLLKNAVTDPVLEMAQRILDMRDGKTPPLFPRVEGPHSVTIRYGVWEDDLFALATAALQKNTRPAPAATDTGLETVGYMAQTRMGWIPSCASSGGEAVCVRSKAEELLAVKDAQIKELEKERDHWKEYSSGQGKLIESGVFVKNDEYVRLTALEADNAAQAARIKILEGGIISNGCQIAYATDGTGPWVRNVRAEALEDKLAAAEKSLEPFAAVLEDYDPDWEDDDVTAVLVVGSVTHYGITLGDFRKARAALGEQSE